MGGYHMNVFRILADVSHTISKCILIWAIHSNKSAEGISLITQVLYALVFCTRYDDLLWDSKSMSTWNFVLKLFYILSSFYIIAIMMKLYARTREQEKAWKIGAACLAGALVLAPLLAWIAKWSKVSLFEVIWTFSLILESVCVIPQLLLLRQTSVPTVIDSGYIVFLGSYRALYILNWIYRYADDEAERRPDWRPVIFGIIQTALYVDFAWVYWTRQRVKLRNGGIVDQDDMSRGFLVGKIFGRAGNDVDEETARSEGDVNTGKVNGGRWGRRGISVSADENEPAAAPKQQTRAHDDDLEDFVDDESDDGSSTRQQQSRGLMSGQKP